MDLTQELNEFLLRNGACEVGFADITNFTTKEGLDTGIVFYITYPKKIIKNMQNAPTLDYLNEYNNINSKL